MASLKEKILKGTFWTLIEQFSGKAFGFIIQIYLARLLIPEDYGLIAMVTIFIGIGTSIMESGFGQSLIRTKKPSEADFSSVFYINILMSIAVYILIYITAPFVSDFYDEISLTFILRVLALIIVIRSFSLVQQTIMTINLDFKKQMIVNLISTIIGGCTATVIAFQGYGIWALVFMQLISNSLMALLFWYFGKWKPKRIFDLDRVKHHYSFGYKLMLSTFVNSIFNYIFDIVIGKFYSSSILGFYNRASTYQKFPTILLGRSINKVTYPMFSKLTDSKIQMKQALKRINKLVIYVYTPFMFLLIFNAKQIIVLLLTEKWLPVVPIFQLLCIGGLFQPIQYYNINIIKSLGDSALILKINFFSRLFIIFGIVLMINYGFYYLIIFQVISMLCVTLCFMRFSGLKIEYNLFEQLKDITVNFSISFLISFLCFYVTTSLNLSDIWSIIFYSISFISFYLIFSQVFKLESYLFIKSLITNKLIKQ
jgi:O-antigen/teichoic acid export membrane protein